VFKGIEVREAVAVGTAFGSMPEYVLFVFDGESESFEIDAATCLEEGGVDDAFCGVTGTRDGFWMFR
jgi:hypothetical protein